MTKMPTPEVQATIAKAVQAEAVQRERQRATGFLDRFLRLFTDYSFSTARAHVRKGVVMSKRQPEEIIAEVKEFFGRKPRPWRPAGNRAKKVHAVRFSYKRAA